MCGRDFSQIPEDARPMITGITAERTSGYDTHYVNGWRLLNTAVAIHAQSGSALEGRNERAARHAIEHLSYCLDLQPDDWRSRWGLGRAWSCLGEHRKALACFEEALEEQDADARPLRAAAETALTLGLRKKALEFATRGTEIYPDDAAFRLQQALAFLLFRKPEEALKAADRAAELVPGEPEPEEVRDYILAVRTGETPWPEWIA